MFFSIIIIAHRIWKVFKQAVQDGFRISELVSFISTPEDLR